MNDFTKLSLVGITAGVIGFFANSYVFLQSSSERNDSFLVEEQVRIDSEMDDCFKSSIDNLTNYMFSRDRYEDQKACKEMVGKRDGTYDQEAYKWCLRFRLDLNTSKCQLEAYKKSIDRMKQYMKGQRK